jgi:hypothetical protein
VIITDHLSQAEFDLTTLSLGPIIFADKVVTPQAGLLPSISGQFNADVDLRPANNLIVHLNGSLDPNTNVLTWRFTSVDPNTGQPPDDPLAGFLPPGAEGSVVFTVRPKKGLPLGTVIRNKATVVFDMNPPLDTPEWFNTLDNAKPTSHVLPLPATQHSAAFNVRWVGTDEGAGVRDFTVYVSDNGGPFTPWLTQTKSTEAVFAGATDHRYSFFSVARDLTGNVEDGKADPEATSQVIPNRSPVVIAKNVNVPAGSSCLAVVSPSEVDGGSFDPHGDVITLSLTPSNPLGLGTHQVLLTATDIYGSSGSAGAAVTVIDQTPPVISNVSVTPAVVWPPDRKMINVTVGYDATDGCGMVVSRLGVSSNEPLDPSDVVIVDAHHLRLRADRRGSGAGRIYTVTIFTMDGYGNLSSKSVFVNVPHDQRK